MLMQLHGCFVDGFWMFDGCFLDVESFMDVFCGCLVDTSWLYCGCFIHVMLWVQFGRVDIKTGVGV